MISICKRFSFEAAHFLPDHAGLCKNLHGHSYKLEVEVTGPINDFGMIMDFGNLSKLVNQCIIKQIDHCNLNELMNNPTAENTLLEICRTLKDILPGDIKLKEIRLWETEKCFVRWVED